MKIVCPHCGKFTALKKDGTIRKHVPIANLSKGGYGWKPRRGTCPASGTKPENPEEV